jgi:hypothetical protein
MGEFKDKSKDGRRMGAGSSLRGTDENSRSEKSRLLLSGPDFYYFRFDTYGSPFSCFNWVIS